jgi:hypothetical protein
MYARVLPVVLESGCVRTLAPEGFDYLRLKLECCGVRPKGAFQAFHSVVVLL